MHTEKHWVKLEKSLLQYFKIAANSFIEIKLFA